MYITYNVFICIYLFIYVFTKCIPLKSVHNSRIVYNKKRKLQNIEYNDVIELTV